MKTILEPLAVAANVTQAADTRLDHVAVMLGKLYHIFSHQDVPDSARTAIHSSLERRWAKSDQDAFIAAVFFNPFYRHHLFNKDEMALKPMGLYSMLKRLFTRVFPDIIFQSGNFMHALEVYSSDPQKGVFSHESMMLQEVEEGVTMNVSELLIL